MITVGISPEPNNTANKIYTANHKNGKSGDIWIGGHIIADSKKFLNQYNINRIICLTSDFKYIDQKYIKYLKLPVQDNPTYDIRQHFREIYNFIRDGTLKGENVLIHCNSGASRSGAIAMMYLMVKGYSLIQAYRRIKRIRSYINPINGFIEQLIKWKYGKKHLSKILDKYNKVKYEECYKIPYTKIGSNRIIMIEDTDSLSKYNNEFPINCDDISNIPISGPLGPKPFELRIL